MKKIKENVMVKGYNSFIKDFTLKKKVYDFGKRLQTMTIAVKS
jgi:hypothetical protein